MAKTNWQDPKTSEMRSTHISGLQEAVGKIEESIGLSFVAETGVSLSEVFISNDDRLRIFQAPEGKRNWLSSPSPVVKKNGAVFAGDFEIDYGGGAIVLTNPALETDEFTADFTRTNSTHSITPASIGAETPTGAQSKADAAETAAKDYADDAVGALAGEGNTKTVKELDTEVESHKNESATQAHLAKNIELEDTAENFTATNIEGAMSELFTSVSDGKNTLETAITDMKGTVSKVGTVATFDELDSGVRSIMSNNIKSIQRGRYTFTTASYQPSSDVAIDSINPSNSLLKFSYDTTTGTVDAYAVTGFIKNATTITFERSVDAPITSTIYYEVVEFENVKSVQKGRTTLTTTATTVPIESIDTSKAIIFASFKMIASVSPTGVGNIGLYYDIQNSTTLAFGLRDLASGGNYTIDWTVIEFN